MRRSRLRTVWAWSWLLTLPVTLLWCSWLRSTWQRYSDFGLRYDSAPIAMKLHELGRQEALHLGHKAWLTLLPEGGLGRAPRDGLRTISLFVPEQQLAQLDAHLPYSGFEYVDAGLWDGSQVIEAKVRYRGDYAVHWGWPKKSLRVKTGKGQLFEGLRSFNLLAPKFAEQLNNYLGYRLAQRLGLLAPRTELVHVALNGKRAGLHVLVEQLDEGTLRSGGRMPGDLFAGELVADDGWGGVSQTVFDHPNLWEKVSLDNHYPEHHREPLERLFELLNGETTAAKQAELSKLLDMQAFGRFAALEILGQTMHYDHTHNWRLFWDKNRGQFEPVAWDPTAWAPHFRPGKDRGVMLDVEVTRLHMALNLNGDFLRARQAAIEEFYHSGQAEAFALEVDETIAQVAEALRVDPNRRPTELDRIQIRTAELRAAIALTLAEVELAYLEPSGRVRFAQLPERSGALAPERSVALSIGVTGRQPVRRLLVDFERPLDGQQTAKLVTLRDGARCELDLSGATSTSGQRVSLELGLLARPRPLILATAALPLKNRRYNYAEGTYELILEGVDADNPIVQVRVERGGAATLPAERVERVPLEPLELFRPALERPALEPLIWSGEVTLDTLTELERDLVIRPGTVVRLAPEASLVLTGRLLAEGTAERPIRFEPAAEEPWGVLALQGPGCSGSVLRHCRMSGGSGLKDGLREYSAFFSVHAAKDVVIDRCTFADSRVVDDMVHAVYSELSFLDCRFERSLSDALDLDICRGSLERCVFVESGNDGIDLMTSKVLVLDTLLESNGDKGISVGEGSMLLSINNRFLDNEIGIQAKDSSIAEVWNGEFVGNRLGLDAYKKNWRYDGGGHLVVHKSHLSGNERAITADKHSAVSVFDSYCDLSVDDKHVTLDVSVDAEYPRQAQRRGPAVLMDAMQSLGGLATRAREHIDTSRRGAREVPPVP